MGPKKVLYAHFIYNSVLGVSKIQIICELVVMTVMSSTEILGVEQKSLEASLCTSIFEWNPSSRFTPPLRRDLVKISSRKL